VLGVFMVWDKSAVLDLSRYRSMAEWRDETVE